MQTIPVYQSYLVALGTSEDLDQVARLLERIGAGGSFRRLSQDRDLLDWCQISWEGLRKRLHRGEKRVWFSTE